MPQLASEKPRQWAKVFGVALAICVALASLALVAITQEPKHADSSPGPVVAAVAAPIADAKSEAEILFRGKSFSALKRAITMPFTGEVTNILVKEGQPVEKDDVLAEYRLDRQAMMQVHQTLYPEIVLNLKRSLYERKISLEKLEQVALPLKKLELERAEKELSDARELLAREMAQRDLVVARERQAKAAKKDVLDVEQSMKQLEADLQNTSENLRFYEAKQKRDLELLEWQTHRSYSDSKVPMDIAYLKAPIAAQVIWIAPEFHVKAEPTTGFQAMTLAPMNPIVVRCKVHELDLVKLKAGDRGTVVFDAFPDVKYPCKISRIPWVSRNPSLEVPADYDLECMLENPDGKIKDGLTCNVRISVTH
jgi:multidrug efflux pump subunit AcrA (membrane-fusion protein)